MDSVFGFRCFSCGEIIDPVIEGHRELRKKEKLPMPEKGNRVIKILESSRNGKRPRPQDKTAPS